MRVLQIITAQVSHRSLASYLSSVSGCHFQTDVWQPGMGVNTRMLVTLTCELSVIDEGYMNHLREYCLHFSICACHPCAGAMLIFSVSFQFKRMIPEGNPWIIFGNMCKSHSEVRSTFHQIAFVSMACGNAIVRYCTIHAENFEDKIR